MKYLPHSVLIVLGAATFLSGCTGNAGYDITKYHDIYRINYKYKPLPPPPSPAESTLPPKTPAAGQPAAQPATTSPVTATPAPATPPAQ